MDSFTEERVLADDELAERAGSGDAAAYAALYERYFDDVYDFALRIVGASRPAARTVEAAFVSAWLVLRGEPAVVPFRAKLFALAHHVALDELRTGTISVEPGAQPEDEVWAAAANLGPQDSSLLDLHLRRQLDAGELAKALGVARGPLAERLERLGTELDRRAGAGAGEALAAVPLLPAPPGLFDTVWRRVAREAHLRARPRTRPRTQPVRKRVQRPRPPERITKTFLFVAGAAALAAIATGAVIAARSGGVEDPGDVRSTSHQIGQPGSNVVVLTWSRQEGIAGYSILWSKSPDDLPDESVELPGSATGARSPELAAGRWWFHLRTQAENGDWTSTVHYGPFVVPPGPDTEIARGPEKLSRKQQATFSFSASENGATFECSLDRREFAPCESPQRYRRLKGGEHRFEVRATGISGAPGEAAAFVWEVDARAPNTRFTRKPEDATQERTARFAFQATEKDARFQCSFDRGPWRPCRSPKRLRNLPDGEHRLEVRARDDAGNVDRTPAVWEWAVDHQPPDSSIVGGPSGATRSRTATFGLAADETDVTFECSFDGRPFRACASPFVVTGLTEGTHALRVRATDAAGNAEQEPATRAWTVDRTDPGTAITSHPPPSTSSRRATFTFSSTEPAATFQCSIDGMAWSSCSTPAQYYDLNSGTHEFRVRARDAAGNLDETPATYTWHVT